MVERPKKELNWTPLEGRCPGLDRYAQAIRECVNARFIIHTHQVEQNVTQAQHNTIHALKTNRNIVIQPTDKGRAMIIQIRIDYYKEVYRQLHNQEPFGQVPADLTKDHNHELNRLIKTFDPVLQSTLCILTPHTSHKVGYFCCLPKIYKANTPGRFIVSGNGTLCENLSGYVKGILKPIVQGTPSFCCDTTDFLQKLNTHGPIETGTFLVTMDVSVVYTHISHDNGIAATASVLNTNCQFPRAILQLNRFILEHNIFTFDNQFFIQTLKNRNDLLRRRDMTDSVPFVVQYFPGVEKLRHILRSLQHVFDDNEHLAKIFPTPPLLTFKQPPNIKQAIVCSKLPSLQGNIDHNTIQPCHGNLCKTHQIIDMDITIT
eukprot:g40929.t1